MPKPTMLRKTSSIDDPTWKDIEARDIEIVRLRRLLEDLALNATFGSRGLSQILILVREEIQKGNIP